MYVLKCALRKYALHKKFDKWIPTCQKITSLYFRATSEGVKN